MVNELRTAFEKLDTSQQLITLEGIIALLEQTELNLAKRFDEPKERQEQMKMISEAMGLNQLIHASKNVFRKAQKTQDADLEDFWVALGEYSDT